MDDARTWVALLNAAALLLGAALLTHTGLITRSLLQRRRGAPVGRVDHAFHLVVPHRDEEELVTATVSHLVTAFPDAVVWCVDDGSQGGSLDGGALPARMAAAWPSVRVVSRRAPQDRRGGGGALDAVWRALDTELSADDDRSRVVLGVVEAGSRLDRGCLAVLCGPDVLGDPSTSSVQVQLRVVQDVDALTSTCPLELATASDPAGDRLLVQLQDLEATGPVAALRALQRSTGSVGSAGTGGNGRFTRMSTLDRVAAEHDADRPGTLPEDDELGLHVLLTGGRTGHVDDTFVAQTGLLTAGALVRRRVDRAQGRLRLSRHGWRVATSPAVPLTAALEVGHQLAVPWAQLVGTLVVPAAIGVDVLTAATAATTAGTAAAGWWAAGAGGLVALVVALGVLPHLVWGLVHHAAAGGRTSRRRALVLGLAHAACALLLLGTVWWALWRTLRGRTDGRAVDRRSAGAAPAAAAPATPAVVRLPAPRPAQRATDTGSTAGASR